MKRMGGVFFSTFFDGLFVSFALNDKMLFIFPQIFVALDICLNANRSFFYWISVCMYFNMTKTSSSKWIDEPQNPIFGANAINYVSIVLIYQ